MRDSDILRAERMRYSFAIALVAVVLACTGAGTVPELVRADDGKADVAKPIATPDAEGVRLRKDRAREAITRLLENAKIPGASIAVIEDFQIEWADGYGVRRAGDDDPVDTETLFQAASISKPVAALAALRLVEAGKLNLDENVNRQLVSWKLPDNNFTEAQKVTLRHLLSHTGGVTVHGFPGYPSDTTAASLLEVLDGKPPANTAEIRVDTIPGSKWRYAGGGYCIIQQMVVDVTGQSFPMTMQELVLEPLEMTRSTYQQPLPKSLEQNAAVAHRIDGTTIPRRWHVYPEMAAAGLWTTPSDLARFFIALHVAETGADGAVLSQALARDALSPQFDGRTGLGPALGGEGQSAHFGHGGSNAGFKCMARLFRNAGHGAVVMINHDNSAIFGQIIDILRDVQGWPR